MVRLLSCFDLLSIVSLSNDTMSDSTERFD